MFSIFPTTFDFGEISLGEVLGEPKSPEISAEELKEFYDIIFIWFHSYKHFEE